MLKKEVVRGMALPTKAYKSSTHPSKAAIRPRGTQSVQTAEAAAQMGKGNFEKIKVGLLEKKLSSDSLLS